MTTPAPNEMPDAYMYELAKAKKDGEYCNWEEHISKRKPNAPEGAMRNLVPLYRADLRAPVSAGGEATEYEVFLALENKLDELKTQKSLAEFFGISEQYMSDIRMHRRAIPDSVCEALGFQKYTGFRRTALQQPPAPEVDLEKLFWDEIKTAADVSLWIPSEYTMNDWVSDVCKYLINGIGDRMPTTNKRTKKPKPASGLIAKGKV